MEKLQISWNKFETNLDELIKKGKELNENNPNEDSMILSFCEEYNDWRNLVIKVLSESFENKDNEFCVEFRISKTSIPQFPNRRVDNFTKLRSEKSALNNDIKNILYFKNMLGVSEAIISPDKIDFEQRKKLTSEDIVEFILFKLYDLYDDNIYPIKPLLEWNGIVLKKNREEFEYLEILLENEFVLSNSIARIADAQLTVKGKMYVEEKQKMIEPNYSSVIPKQQIDEKLDELKDKLTELGYGNEILFEELQELKEMYKYLNNKNWGQLVKGKLIDLGISQVINKETMTTIYEFMTNDVLRLP